MRIALVADKLDKNRGGSNHSLHITAREMSDRGHDVEIVLLNIIFPDNDLPDGRNYSVIEEGHRITSRLKAPMQIVKVFRRLEDEFDVFHVWNPRIGPFAGAYRMIGGSTPVVVRLNAYFFCANTDRMRPGCWESCSVRTKIRHDTRLGATALAKLPEHVFDTYATPFLLNRCDKLFAQSPAVAEVYEAIGVDRDRIKPIGSMIDVRGDGP